MMYAAISLNEDQSKELPKICWSIHFHVGSFAFKTVSNTTIFGTESTHFENGTNGCPSKVGSENWTSNFLAPKLFDLATCTWLFPALLSIAWMENRGALHKVSRLGKEGFVFSILVDVN